MTVGRARERFARSPQARLTLLALATYLGAIVLVYGRALTTLWHDWTVNPNYSHGMLVVPVAGLLAWRRRIDLAQAPLRPSRVGALLVAASLALFVAGTLAAEIFTTRASIVGVVAGTIVYVFGWRHLRLLAFPVAFLLFMIPLPAIVFDQMTASLQLVASTFGEHLLRLADVPVLRDGNVLTLSAITLNVTETCSGIRSLVSLLAFTSLFAYLMEPTALRRAVLTLSAIPLAISLNGARIAITGIAAGRIGPEMAIGVVHEATGWAIFLVALLCVALLHRAMDALAASRTGPAALEPA